MHDELAVLHERIVGPPYRRTVKVWSAHFLFHSDKLPPNASGLTRSFTELILRYLALGGNGGDRIVWMVFTRLEIDVCTSVFFGQFITQK
jgi:hypothetical protein